MPFNGSGTFVRTQNWSNDAANNLPISATKFDNEDNDFAGGLSLCLTRDGQGVPTAPLTWSQQLTINRASDGQVAAWGRTGGVNNPQLQLTEADGTGVTLNLSTAQTLALAIQSANVIALTGSSVTVSQPETINAPANLIGLTVNASNANTGNTYAAKILGGTAAGFSSGLEILAGTNASDAALLVQNQAATQTFLEVFGDGHGQIGPTTALGATWSTAGAWNFPAATAAATLTVNAAANQYAQKINGSSTSGQSFGVLIGAGSTSADAALTVENQAATLGILAAYGNGEVTVGAPTASVQMWGSLAGTTQFQVGYLDMPTSGGNANFYTTNYTAVMSDRGKIVMFNAAGLTFTIPANATVPFPVGSIIMVYANANNLTISVTTDTLSFLPSAATGSRTLAANSVCTLLKTQSTVWRIWGFGLS